MLAGQRSIRYLVPDLGKVPTRSESSRGRRNALASNFSPLSLSMHAFIFYLLYLFSSFICCLNLTSFVIFFLSSLLITSLGHIKLTDFGLSKIGLMNSKYSFFPFVSLYCFAFPGLYLEPFWSRVLCTPYQFAYSPYCSLYFYEENLCNNQEPLEFAIISLILVTVMFDSGVIL